MRSSSAAQTYGDYLSARFAGMIGDPAAAASFYRRAFERDPDDASLLEPAVFATLIAGDTPAAVAISSIPSKAVAAASPSTQLVLVVDDVAHGRRARALTRLKAARLGAIHTDLVNFLSAWLMWPDDLNAALASLDVPDGRRMLIGEQYYMKAFILLAAHRDAEAREAFEIASRYPVNAPAFFVAERARFYASLGETLRAREEITAFARASGAGAETDAVLAMIDSGQTVQPHRLALREGAALAMWLASSGALTRANPELATLRNALALHVDPDFAPARLQLATALADQDRKDDAADVLAGLASESPWYADALLRQARLFSDLNRPAEALAAADKASAASRRRDILLGVADLDRDHKRFAQAETLYTDVIAADAASRQEDWRVFFARGTAREALDRWPEAEGDLTRALALSPASPDLQNFLGYGWVKRGEKVEEGMSLIRQAVASRPDRGYIVDSLGWAYFQLGDYSKAVEHLERAVELSPDDVEILSHLGDVYWRLDRRLEATFEWRRALAFKPDAEETESLKTRLANGLPERDGRTLAAASQGRP